MKPEQFSFVFSMANVRSVPGAVATGSQRSSLIHDGEDETRSLSLPVLTSLVAKPFTRLSSSYKQPMANEKCQMEDDL